MVSPLLRVFVRSLSLIHISLAKGALEGVTVRLVGEVSEVSNKPGYKAVYFTVKDKSAALPCMMWNNRYQAAGVSLSVGMLVELTGRFTVYAPCLLDTSSCASSFCASLRIWCT